LNDTASSSTQHAPGLRARLVALVLAVLIPAVMAGGLLMWTVYRQQREFVERQMMETARALSLVVDREIGQKEVLLRVLASSPHLRSENWAAFDAQARQATEGGETWVVVFGPDGLQKVNTRLAPGTPLPAGAGRAPGLTWSKTEDGQMYVSNLFHGAVAKEAIISFNTSVERSGAPPLILAAGASAKSFGQVWIDQQFPQSWTGSIIDGRGVIVARNRNPDQMIGKPASPIMMAHLREGSTGVARTTTLDGVASLSAWSTSPDYGWSFIVAMPLAEIAGRARQSLFWGAALGVLFLTFGAVLAIYAARSVARPVERLADGALAWAETRPPAPFPTGTKEIDALAAALNEAGNKVADQRAELLALNASLEARVTERTRELAEAMESLAQAQKMEAIGRLTGGVAHDFNNLLMAVLGNLDLLSRRLTDPKHVRYLEQARAAGERGAKLTGQLLAFSRRQRLEVKAMDIGEAVEAAAALLRPTIGGAHQLDVEVAPDLWPALGDATQVELMVVNLSVNARDAMAAGGVVSISASNVTVAGRRDRGEAPPAGDYVMIAVADTGEGMTPEIAARVFEPFFTTKPLGKGSGLGLPQVLGLAKQLGGGVEIDTAPDQGTTVRVYLPRAAAFDAVAATDELPPDSMALRGLKVLLVDDDVGVRTVTAQMLKDLGCRVTVAENGEQALERMREDPTLQAALVDFAMPGLSGGETAAGMRWERADFPVVIMTGYADLEELAETWSGPLMHKPFSMADLAREMARAIPE
jgi:signal transduction histidine kinase